MYENILLPVAPESDATGAMPHVVSLANRYDATVHVIAAADTMEETLRGPRVGALAERLETAASDRVDAVEAELADQGIDVATAVKRGAPHAVIRDAIDDVDADLVVMLTHTRRGVRRVLLGSVTERVIRQSPIPVLSVPIRDEEPT